MHVTSLLRPAAVTIVLLVFAGCGGGRPDTLGPRNGSLAPCPSTPNCVHTGLRHPDGTRGMFIRGSITRGEIIPRLRDILGSMPGTRLIRSSEDYIHAEVRSPIFRFVDDVELLILPNRELVVRSASRVGKRDRGANVERVEELRRLLTEAEILR